MRFTQIRHANGTTHLKWQGHHNSDSLTTDLTSEDKPHDGFMKAMEALQPRIPKLIGAPKEYADGVEVRSLNISYQKGDRRGFVVHAIKPVECANGPFNINTPMLLEPDLDSDSGGQAGQDLMELFEELVEQARLFVDGRREQGELFTDGGDKAARAQQQREADHDRAAEIDRVVLYLVGDRPETFESWDDEMILSDVLGALDEHLDGKGFAQFSHLNTAGTRRSRCAISTEGGVPRLWYGVDGKIDPAHTAATLMGRDLVATIRRAWSKVPDQMPLAPDAEPRNDAAEWLRALRPSPAPSDTVTTEIVAQCLHTILSEAPVPVIESLHQAHQDGTFDGEIWDCLEEAFDARAQGAEKVGFTEPIGIKSSENVQHVTVDIVVHPITMQVKLSNKKKQKLDAGMLITIARGMLDISDPPEEDPNFLCLITVPASDINFRSTLESASAEVLERVLEHYPEGTPNQKTRRTAIERQLRKLEKEAVPV